MGKLKPVSHDEQLSLVDHLDELRSRLIYSIIFLSVAFAICFWQSSHILDIAAAPLPEKYQALIVLAPTEAFMTTVTVCAYAAIIVSAPFSATRSLPTCCPHSLPASAGRFCLS